MVPGARKYLRTETMSEGRYQGQPNMILCAMRSQLSLSLQYLVTSFIHGDTFQVGGWVDK